MCGSSRAWAGRFKPTRRGILPEDVIPLEATKIAKVLRSVRLDCPPAHYAPRRTRQSTRHWRIGLRSALRPRRGRSRFGRHEPPGSDSADVGRRWPSLRPWQAAPGSGWIGGRREPIPNPRSRFGASYDLGGARQRGAWKSGRYFRPHLRGGIRIFQGWADDARTPCDRPLPTRLSQNPAR
jgi:hypothetical protein